MTGTGGTDLETSPYKSKFTVLKFSVNSTDSKNSKKISPYLSIGKQSSDIKAFNLSPEKVQMGSSTGTEQDNCAVNLFA